MNDWYFGLLLLNPHGHFLVLDGVYAAAADEAPGFYSLRPIDAKDVAEVAGRVAERVALLMEKHDGTDTLDHDERAMAEIYGASITGRTATGANSGAKLKTAGDLQAERQERFEMRGSLRAMAGGFSVHAGVSIRAGDRKGLERLCKYVSRPPLAVDRLEQLPDGRLSYQLKSAWQNGATHVIFEPLELLARLSALVPAPRVNLIRYYGVLGPAAKWRASIVPAVAEIEASAAACGHDESRAGRKQCPRNYSWAALMKRVFEFDVLKCPDCNGRLKILAAIHPPIHTRKILECMGLPSRAPPVARAVSQATTE